MNKYRRDLGEKMAKERIKKRNTMYVVSSNCEGTPSEIQQLFCVLKQLINSRESAINGDLGRKN